MGNGRRSRLEVDRRTYQIADCLTKHSSRKSEEVWQHGINQAQWLITAEGPRLETRLAERGAKKVPSGSERMRWDNFTLEECKQSSFCNDPRALREIQNGVADDPNLLNVALVIKAMYTKSNATVFSVLTNAAICIVPVLV